MWWSSGICQLRAVCVVFVLVLAAATVSAAPGNQLFINGENVNMRSGPGTSFAVVAKLARGQELVEFGRQDEWVNVGVARPGGHAGWVHTSLVSKSIPGDETNKPP